MISPLVSVIIPTFNSEVYLDTCLKSVFNQSYKNIEVIIVDNFSNDNTLNIAKKYGCNVFRKKAFRSEARNYGAKKSKGDFLLFLDSDTQLTRGVISSCVKSIFGNGALIIPEKIIGSGFWLKIKAFERELYLGSNVEAPWFFEKKAFLRLGGYDIKIEAGEDWDLRQRLTNAGFKIGYVDSLILHNQIHLNFFGLIKKKFYYGKSILRYVKKNKSDSISKFPLFRFDVLKNNFKKIIKNPLKFSGVVFLKTIETLSLVFGMFYYKIRGQQQ